MPIDLARLTNLAEQAQARAATAQRHTADGRCWYRITNRAQDVAEVYIYDAIGVWGVSARDFVEELRGITAGSIDLHLNSPGGSVFDGVAIYNGLVNHKAKVTTYVDALAASAASFIAMAGDEIIIEKNARMMIHDASGLCIGNAKDMRDLADLLDSLSDTIAELYADRAGGSRQQWREAMLAETWYTAAEAVAAGLADRIQGKATDDPDEPEDAARTPVNEAPTQAPATTPQTPEPAAADPENEFDPHEFKRQLEEAFSS